MIKELQDEVRSKFGDQLGKIERWSSFRTDETTDEWLRLLGPTAVVLSHQEHLVETTIEIADQHLPEDDLALLLAAWAVHDLGEIVKGDISAQVKKTSDEYDEHKAALRLIAQLEHHKLASEAYKQVVVGENPYMNQLFRAIEKSEYVMTAMHVFDQIRNEEHEGRDKLWLMIARVIAIDLPKVLDHCNNFPEILGSYFRNNCEVINEMFDLSQWRVTDDFETRFEASWQKWQDWLAK